MLLPNEAGVYFLYQIGDVLVYIGKAQSLFRRVHEHEKEMIFCRVGYETTHYSRARILEKELIELYVNEHGQFPLYNKRH
ncbi:MAG: hypothetical protein A2Z28_05445 [Chloroflexi bacterium RBG_16_51_9]|nr:MAG: hypothetical protein A2Z28_05445 [Chloroflexi bacterium RBG_16_51_9]